MLLPNYKCLNVLVQSWLCQRCPNHNPELYINKFHSTPMTLVLKTTRFPLCPSSVLTTEGHTSKISNFHNCIFEFIFHSAPGL